MYRVILFVILIVAGIAVISLIAQGDTGVGENGIFRLFGDLSGDPTLDPSGEPSGNPAETDAPSTQ